MNQSNFQLDPSGAELLQLLRARNIYRDTAAELLEALEALTACTPETYDNRHELAAARDAIAKAKGKA